MTMDQVCAKLVESESIMGFKDIKYDSLNNDDQVNLEGTMIDMTIKFRHTPLGLGTEFLVGLYKRVDAKWKWALSTKKEKRNNIGTSYARFREDTHVYSP